jgi:acetyl esterase/lipase
VARKLRKKYKNLSPLNHLSRYTPPTVVLHCAQDEFYAEKIHGAALAAALAAKGTPQLLINPAMHSHGCDIGSTAPFQLMRFALLKFLAAVAASKPPQ